MLCLISKFKSRVLKIYNVVEMNNNHNHNRIKNNKNNKINGIKIK